MPQSKKPSYYEKKYFDEKFSHVVNEVREVKDKVEKMNGDVAEIKEEQTRIILAQREKSPIFDSTVKKVEDMEKRYLYISGVSVGLGTMFGYIVSHFLN